MQVEAARRAARTCRLEHSVRLEQAAAALVGRRLRVKLLGRLPREAGAAVIEKALSNWERRRHWDPQPPELLLWADSAAHQDRR